MIADRIMLLLQNSLRFVTMATFEVGSKVREHDAFANINCHLDEIKSFPHCPSSFVEYQPCLWLLADSSIHWFYTKCL